MSEVEHQQSFHCGSDADKRLYGASWNLLPDAQLMVSSVTEDTKFQGCNSLSSRKRTIARAKPQVLLPNERLAGSVIRPIPVNACTILKSILRTYVSNNLIRESAQWVASATVQKKQADSLCGRPWCPELITLKALRLFQRRERGGYLAKRRSGFPSENHRQWILCWRDATLQNENLPFVMPMSTDRSLAEWSLRQWRKTPSPPNWQAKDVVFLRRWSVILIISRYLLETLSESDFQCQVVAFRLLCPRFALNHPLTR